MPKEQTNIRLDEQAKQDAQAIAAHYNLNGMAAAIRFALRDMARRVSDETTPKVTPSRGNDTTIRSEEPHRDG